MLGIFFGGNSLEHDISIITAFQVKKRLNDKYKILLIYCDFYNNFYDASKLTLTDFKNNNLRKLRKRRFSSKHFGTKKIECMLLAGHGENSEDGLFASICDIYKIPFVGCSPLSSGIALNKWYTYLFLESIGVNTIKTEKYSLDDYLQGKKPVDYPVIIKPVCGGSSIGIHVCKNETEFIEKIVKSFDLFKEVIIQPFYENVKEYNIAVANQDISFMESISKQEEIFSFNNKYNESFKMTHQKLLNTNEEVVEMCRNVYKELDLSGIVRMDLFEIGGKFFLSEINTTPGALAMYLFDDFDNIIKKCINSALLKKKPQYMRQNLLSNMEIKK